MEKTVSLSVLLAHSQNEFGNQIATFQVLIDSDALIILLQRRELCITVQRKPSDAMIYTAIITSIEWGKFFERYCPKYRLETPTVFRSKKDLWKAHHGLIEAHYDKSFEEFDWQRHNKNTPENADIIIIQQLAEEMWDLLQSSIPQILKAGKCHIPFGESIEVPVHIETGTTETGAFMSWDKSFEVQLIEKIKVAAVRIATGSSNYDHDLVLMKFQELLEKGDLSMLGHFAKAQDKGTYESCQRLKGGFQFWWNKNLLGWEQFVKRVD